MYPLFVWLLIGAIGGLLVNITSPRPYRIIWWLDLVLMVTAAVLSGLVVVMIFVAGSWSHLNEWSYIGALIGAGIIGLDQHSSRDGELNEP